MLEGGKSARATHSVGVTRAVLVEKLLMTILGADSTALVLGCSSSPEELMSAISRQAVMNCCHARGGKAR